MRYTEQQKNAEEMILEGHKVLITGQAGTGKTALIKEIHFDLTFIYICNVNFSVFSTLECSISDGI